MLHILPFIQRNKKVSIASCKDKNQLTASFSVNIYYKKKQPPTDISDTSHSTGKLSEAYQQSEFKRPIQ